MSNKQNVRVSIVMIITGTDAGLQRRLDSVLTQLGSGDEIILVGRNGADATACAAAHINDAKILSIEAGFAENLEAALRQSSGDYIFLAESCDTWHPGKLAGCIEALEQGVTAAIHNAVVVDGDLNELESSLLGHQMSQRPMLDLFRNRSIGCCMAFRRELLAAALPLPPSGLSPDRWLWATARKIGRVAFIDRALMFYCSHRTAAGRSRAFNAQRKRTGFRELCLVAFVLNRRIRMLRSECPDPK